MNDPVDFYCAAADHQTPIPAERLTMHDERWAYCPSGGSGAHRWVPTGGMTLTELKRALAARRSDRAP